ncbi:MAG: MFS transporter [Myxococcota bacterium]
MRVLGTDGKFTGYHWRLLAFLSVATFFEGYDFMALTQILPELRKDFGLDRTAGGLLVGIINVGTVLAYVLIRKADHWGRRRVLTVTIAGYTLFTGLSGLAPNVWWFGGLQLIARVFLIAEWATSFVIAAEEFPAAKRGMVIGIIQAFVSAGAIACAGVVPLLKKLAPEVGPAFLWLPEGTDYRWRIVYFVGVVPLLMLAFARRNLKETQRFTDQVAAQTAAPPRRSFFYIFTTRHRTRMLQLGLIWFVTYLCTQNGVTFWKEFAVAEAGLSDEEVGLAISVAAIGSLPMVFAAGKLLDVVGRRHGAAIIFGLGSLGVFLAYTLSGLWPLTAALVFGIFCASATMPVLNAYNTELFPTDVRSDAFAWSNNLLGRIGYVLSPIAVGWIAEQVGAWGPVLQVISVFPIIAVILIYVLLPETKNRELEETATL